MLTKNSIMTANRQRRCVAGVMSDNGGVAAVEFAMLVPIMIMLFIGAVEFGQALSVDRRVTQSASSSADLIARAPVDGLTTADVDGQMQIINQLMVPYDLAPLTVKVVSVIARPVGPPPGKNIIVDWSRDNHGGTPYARNSAYALPSPALLDPGESVIIAEATYLYTPLIFNYFLTSAFNLKETFYLKPRNSSCVNLKPISCVTGNPI